MKRIYYILFSTIALFSCEKPISDFQSKNFFKLFGSGYESKGNDVIEISDGGYVIAGYDKINETDYQLFVDKLDENGNSIWGGLTFGDSDLKEEGKIVNEVSDGFVIAGTSLGSSGIVHSFILKIDFEGNQIYSKQFGDANYGITVNDIITVDNSIYVVGFSDVSKNGSTDYYVSKLDNLGETIWEKSFSIGKNSSFKKAFIRNNDLLLIGIDGIENRMSIIPISSSTGIPSAALFVEGLTEKAVDAAYSGDQLYLLSTIGTSMTKLTKLGSSNELIWRYESINEDLTAKAFGYQSDGSVMVCGESGPADNSLIHFIKINPDGTIFNSDDFFKTLGGNVNKIIETRDMGLIMVGSTVPTYGMNIQLIKTDKDYFMLKNN